MQTVAKKRVGVLRGGAGENYNASLRRGGEIISHISENLADKYKVVDILIDGEGNWHINGRPTKPSELVSQVEVVWNTADYAASLILNDFSIPNIGSDSFSAVVGDSHEMLRRQMAKIGIPMPRSI